MLYKRHELKRKINHDKFVKDCVITMVADTFQKFDLILKWTRKLAASRELVVDKAQVTNALENAIRNKYVAAYEVSLRSPMSAAKLSSHTTLRDLARPARYSTVRLQELWFYATAKGKRSAKGIPNLSGGKL